MSANPALQNNLTYTFLAEGVTAGAAVAGGQRGDRVHLTPLDEIEALIEGGGFVQALHTAPLLQLLLRRASATRGPADMPMPEEIVGLLRSTITFKWADGHETTLPRARSAPRLPLRRLHRGDLRPRAAGAGDRPAAGPGQADRAGRPVRDR